MKLYKYTHTTLLLCFCFIMSSCGKPDYSYTYTNWETNINGKERHGGTREYEQPPVKCKTNFPDDAFFFLDYALIDEYGTVELTDNDYFLERAKKQKKGVWCWAASLQSILRFKGINISQDEIVYNIHQSASGTIEEGGDLYDMLRTIEELSFYGENILVTEVYRSFDSDPVAFIVDNLKQNQPVLCGFFDKTASQYGHVGVITGVDFERNSDSVDIISLTVWDPLIGTSYKKLSCRNFKNLVEFLVAVY